ncbi:ATP-binding protein [Ottowia sp.]|uniref:COG4315 family predicted lipoprotein n=1 Tax=Ottowia sp. TaxID=1898956 RepID=UPI0026000CC1|nr:ATP-binding protein [Ottowia sp.]MBK6748039.1 ATP-binding protein [Ottowia sp.]
MKALITAVATAALLAACGTTGTSRTSAAMPSTPTQAADGTLIGPDGRTLYTFSRDVAGSGKSVCVETCATNWPPLGVAAAAQPRGDYTIITRADGSKQWAFRGMPLYYFIKDTKPGDKMGQGMGGVWNVAKP